MISKELRDFVLAVLSVCGILYIIGRYTVFMFYVFQGSFSLDLLKFMIIFQSVIFLVAGLVFWEKFNISRDYHKYFIMALGIILVLDLSYVLFVLFS